MKKKYFYNVWGKFKCNYFKILAWIGFLYVIFLRLMVKENLDTAKMAFVNVKSLMPIKILNFLVPFSILIWLVMLHTIDSIDKKFKTIKNHMRFKKNNKNKSVISNITYIIYAKLIPILFFVIILMLFTNVIYRYSYIKSLTHKPTYVIAYNTIFNLTNPNLMLMIISFAFITMLILLMIFNIINKTAFIEKELNIISNKNIDNIPSKVSYIKKFSWFIFISAFLTFIYVSKVYLSNPNFQNIKLGFVDYYGSPTINSKMDVLLLTNTILYVGLISLFLLLVLYTAMTKIISIKNHIIDIEKNKNSLKVSLSSNGTWIKVLALINLLVSIGFSIYVYKYFGKNHITIYLPTGTQSPIVSNPVTVILSITNFYIGVVVPTFLFMVYKVRDDVKFIENNLEIVSNKE